jgi:hypothetical protein
MVALDQFSVIAAFPLAELQEVDGERIEMTVECLVIPERDGLDTITVFWQNFELGKGRVVIECWGCAWASYFGGMGNKTIQQFFSMASNGYLVNKLGFTQWLKRSKRHEAYLGTIIGAIQAELPKGEK